MNRAAFEHVVRAAADVAQDEIVVIGSQAILGQFPDAPEALLVSLELDVYPKSHPARADLIDGALGDGSMFHETYGYYRDRGGAGRCRLAPTAGRDDASQSPRPSRGPPGSCAGPTRTGRLAL